MGNRSGAQVLFKDDEHKLTIDFRILAPRNTSAQLLLNEAMHSYAELVAEIKERWLPLGGRELVVKTVDIGLSTQRLVVLEAPERCAIHAELWAQMLADPDPRFCEIHEGRFTVGQAGEGVGVVTYEVTEWPPDDPDRHADTLSLRKVIADA